MRGPKFYLALWLSKGIACAIDLIAKGRGTNLPGAVALKIDPQFLRHFHGIDPEKTIFLTGTNGKSTTTNLLSQILMGAGYRVISNLDGANMTAGVAVPLLKNSSLTGKLKCDYVVMETDERYVARIRQQIPAKYLCITNIQKDQVQRNGEPSFIREKIRQAISPEMTVFVNQDDPNSNSLTEGGRTIRYGVSSNKKSFFKEHDFFAVSSPCPCCHDGLIFHHYNLDNIGTYHCPTCGFSNADIPDYQARAISFEDKHFEINGSQFPFHCNSPEFLYSYTLAAAAALELGAEPDAISRGFDRYGAPVGRGEIHMASKHKIKFFRMKQENSETLQSAVNLLSSDKSPKTLIFGLDEYIDFYPPYINGCYMFDCSFHKLRESGVERCICTSPALGRCGALRFLYDGFSPNCIQVLPDSEERTLASALDEWDSDNIYLIEEIPFWKR